MMFPMGLFYLYECRRVTLMYTGKVPDVVLTSIRVIEITGAQQYGNKIIELVICLRTESLVRLYRVTSACDIEV